MAKAKTPLLDKNLEKFINNNYDKKDRAKDESVKFEWFVNSMHIWQCSSQAYNANTKIGKVASLGPSQGGDAFFISINNFEMIYTLSDNISDILQYLKTSGKSIKFHFIQTKKSNSISWPQFLNLIEIPLKVWKGQDFDNSQPILQKLQEFIDAITEESDIILNQIEHKIEVVFYSNKDNEGIVQIEKEWATNINGKKSELSQYFSSKNIEITFRGSDFLNEIYEKMHSNVYSLAVSKDEVIEAEEKKYLIGYITAKELLDAIAPKVNGIRVLYPDVFKNNIRLYLGRNEINKEIETTLIDEPKKFHFYNNGLTITTKEISDQNSKNYIVSPVDIVNGCQTANSVYNASKSEKFNENDIKIPVKIIVAKDNAYESITIRTNTQNGLEAKDLISITNIQKDLQEQFEKANYLGKSFYYKRQKSGEENETVNVDFIVQIDDILRASFSTLMLIPNKVSGYFDQTTLRYINKIFDERFTKIYVIVTILFKIIEENVDEKYPEFNRLKYHLLYLIYRMVSKDTEYKTVEEYFREINDDMEDETVIKQGGIINIVYSNINRILKNQQSFDRIMDYITNNIKINYPALLDLSDREKEKILYRPVEKLKRTRAIPVFENYQSIFTTEIEALLV